jgi:hypothetical protein
MKKAIDYLAKQFQGRRPKMDEMIERLETLTFKHEKEDTSVPAEDDTPF